MVLREVVNEVDVKAEVVPDDPFPTESLVLYERWNRTE
jgi:hypothetical protein